MRRGAIAQDGGEVPLRAWTAPVANAAVVPVNTANDQVTFLAGVSVTDLVVDVNGYYAAEQQRQLERLREEVEDLENLEELRGGR